jgi:TRAP-type C4-dicarboxylate transport system permease small subunit
MLERLSELVERVSCGVMVACLAVMVGVVFVQVVWRYAFAASIFWSEELTRYLMIWGTMLAAGVCLRRGAHMAIRFLHDLLPPAWRRRTSLLVYALILIFLGTVTYYGLIMVVKMWYQRSTTLFLPMGLVYIAIPLGCLLMIIHTLALLARIQRQGGLDEPAGPASPGE